MDDIDMGQLTSTERVFALGYRKGLARGADQYSCRSCQDHVPSDIWFASKADVARAIATAKRKQR